MGGRGFNTMGALMMQMMKQFSRRGGGGYRGRGRGGYRGRGGGDMGGGNPEHMNNPASN